MHYLATRIGTALHEHTETLKVTAYARMYECSELILQFTTMVPIIDMGTRKKKNDQ